MPQGAAGVPHAAPPPPHPPSAAAPPGVHAQVAQNGTVYYHQPVRKIDFIRELKSPVLKSVILELSFFICYTIVISHIFFLFEIY